MLGMENVFTLAKSRDVKWMLGDIVNQIICVMSI